MKKSELRKIIREEIQSLTEANKFTVTVEKVASGYAHGVEDEQLAQQSFDDEKDAVKYRKQMVKKYKLTRQRGFWGNAKTSIELTTNF